MNIVVLLKLVPDLVEELEIDESGTALDTTWLRMIINEFDDHALEQAMLIKDSTGGQVTVLAPEYEDIDDVLYTAAAKGADRLIKLTGDVEHINNHALARAATAVIQDLQADLVLTGVQANNDLDGSVGPLLAGYLEMPYVGYVAGLTIGNGNLTARKEYPGGLIAEMDMALPAVLGVQAAEEPPRYVAVSKVRMAMKSAVIEEQDLSDLDPSGGAAVGRMFQPEVGERATMLEGDEDEVADQLVELFRELGVL
jgi:electron transfer flavoprotein beta subunit